MAKGKHTPRGYHHAPSIGDRFTHKHAAGVTEFVVARSHRDCGYWECVSKRGVSGTLHGIGSIEVFSTEAISKAKGSPTPDIGAGS